MAAPNLAEDIPSRLDILEARVTIIEERLRRDHPPVHRRIRATVAAGIESARAGWRDELDPAEAETPRW